MIIRIRNFSILLTIVFLVILIDQSFKINAKTKLLNNTFFLSNNLMFVYYDPPNLGEKILSLYELVKIYFFMPLFLVGLIFFYIKKVRRKNKILLFCLPLVIGGGFSIFLDYFFYRKKISWIVVKIPENFFVSGAINFSFAEVFIFIGLIGMLIYSIMYEVIRFENKRK